MTLSATKKLTDLRSNQVAMWCLFIVAPENVLDGCYADVSLLAGMMVDKAVYHLPLYRQHQRLIGSGIQLSRATLTNWIFKSIELLRPIYDAQLKHILTSQVLGMDEVPIKAGRKSKGKMKPSPMRLAGRIRDVILKSHW